MTHGGAAARRVLFVTYGSGHVRMVVPVAKALAARGARPQVLALTTAAPVARAAGLEVLQFKDFITGADVPALDLGREMMRTLSGPVLDVGETAAYLGLSMSDLIDSLGAEGAQAAFSKFGRQAFLPTRTVGRILDQVQPALVVATNSPRAERAAVTGARQRGIPAVCMVDLFAIDEVEWLRAPDYADHVCVLNESVRQFLIDSGRSPAQVSVTGNPAFDALNAPMERELGQRLRALHGWSDRRVVLWPTQVEPAFHPIDGRPGDTALPLKALAETVRWVMGREDTVLCVRPRAGEAAPPVPAHPRIFITGQDWPLAPLLHAVDLVAALNSTVALEGHLAGCRVVQVLGSMFDKTMPMEHYGIADASVPLSGLANALDRWIDAPRREALPQGAATARVLAVIERFL